MEAGPLVIGSSPLLTESDCEVTRLRSGRDTSNDLLSIFQTVLVSNTLIYRDFFTIHSGDYLKVKIQHTQELLLHSSSL